MAWIRSGDTSATYPKLMRVRSLPTADERSVNEVMGFVTRLAMQSGAHLTDYVVDIGTVELMGGPRTKILIRQCERVGLLTEVEIDKLKHYKIHEDPDFIHLRLKAEIEWAAQQTKDCRNRKIAGPVRVRDGDHCRYCGVMVMWRGRPSANSATLDHTEPGQPATVATMIVACRGCNGGLRDINLLDRDEPQPAPVAPYYSEYTANVLTDWGYPTEPTQRPDHQPGTAKRATRKGKGQRPATADTAPTRQRPGSQPDTAPEQRPADADNAQHDGKRPATTDTAPNGNAHYRAYPETIGTESAGSGRVGSGGSPRSAGSSTPDPAGTGRRRSRRGKRD